MRLVFARILALGAVMLAAAPAAMGFLANRIPLASRALSTGPPAQGSNKQAAGGRRIPLMMQVSAGGAKEAKIQLGSGVEMGYWSLPAAQASGKPPLIFVHGSYHGGWCWAVNWMPFFSLKGYDCYAVSLRGTSSTPLPAEAQAAGAKTVIMDDHVADLAAFIDSALPEGSPPPALLGHSFGGMYVQKFIEAGARPLHAAAMMCSVPPSGNGAIVGRFIRNKPLLAIDIVRGLVFKQAASNLRIARRLFFSETKPSDEEIREYMARFAEDGLVTLDVLHATKIFPTKTCATPEGKADFLGRAPPLFVLGAEKDSIVDLLGVEETADFYGTDKVMVKCAHDVMLDDGWEEPAEAVASWLQGTLK